MKRITIIENWRESYKFWSIKVMGLMFVFPDIYNQLSSAGYLEDAPHEILVCMRVFAGVGMLARLLSQRESK